MSAAGLPVRALGRNPQKAGLPAAVEVVGADLLTAETLDDALDNVGAVFLVWVAPLAPAARVIEGSHRVQNASCFFRLQFERTTPSSSSPSRSGMYTRESRI